MAFVAERRGVRVVQLDCSSRREISPLRDAIAGCPARAADPRAAAAHPAHAHREGRRGRPPRGAARRRRAPADRRPHLPRPRPARLLRAAADDARSGSLERWLARVDDALVAVSPQVRDDLVALGVAPAREVRGRPARDRARRARRGAGPASARRDAALLGVPPERVRRRLDRPDDRRQADRRRAARRFSGCASAASTRRSAWSATAPTASASSSARTQLGIVRHCLFLGYQEDVAPLVRRLRRVRAARRRTRGRRWSRSRRSPRAARSSRRASAASRTSSATASTASSSRPATSRRWPSGSSGSRATRSCARGWARPAASACPPRYAVERLVDDVDGLYRSLLATKTMSRASNLG